MKCQNFANLGNVETLADRVDETKKGLLFKMIAVIGEKTGCPVSWGNCNADMTRIEIYVGKLMTYHAGWDREEWRIGSAYENIDMAHLNMAALGNK